MDFGVDLSIKVTQLCENDKPLIVEVRAIKRGVAVKFPTVLRAGVNGEAAVAIKSPTEGMRRFAIAGFKQKILQQISIIFVDSIKVGLIDIDVNLIRCASGDNIRGKYPCMVVGDALDMSKKGNVHIVFQREQQEPGRDG